MSDPEPSGAATPAAETASTPSTPPDPTPPPSTFSNNRGSGLARGKRPISPSAQAATAAPTADYKPTAVSILTAPTEYKNPFAPPAPAAAPAEASTQTPSPIPAAAVAPVAEAPAASASPAAEAPPAWSAPGRTPGSEPGRTKSVEAEAKPAELKILPPEATKRVEHNWESDSFHTVASQPGGGQVRPTDVPPAGPRREDRRGERPVFRPERERRDDRPAEPRAEPRPAWGEPDRTSGNETGRTEFPPAPRPEAPKKSGGFFGWLKRLFGGSPAETTKPEADSRGQREFSHEDQHHRRHRRGGRGRHFHGDQRGPRDGQSGGQPSGENRGYGGEHRNHGGRRRRHYRGGGGYRGDGRPEGGPPAGS